jgi:cytochrome P450
LKQAQRKPKIDFVRLVALEGLYSLARQFRSQKMCVVWFGPEPRLILYDPELVGQVMSKHLDRSPEYNSFQNVPTIVFNAKTDVWRTKRRQMLPAFAVTTVNNYMSIIDDQTRRMMHKMFPEDRPIEEHSDTYQEVTLLLLQIVFASCFGPPAPNDAELSEFLKSAHGFFAGVLVYSLCLRDYIFNATPMGRTFRKHVLKFNDYATKLFDQCIAKYDAERGQKSLQEFVKSKPDKYFIDIMLQIYFDEQTVKNPKIELYTKKTLVGELLLFIFGGFDTVATSLFWTLYLLGKRCPHFLFLSKPHTNPFLSQCFVRSKVAIRNANGKCTKKFIKCSETTRNERPLLKICRNCGIWKRLAKKRLECTRIR